MKKLPGTVKTVGPTFWNAKGILFTWAGKIGKRKKVIYLTGAGIGDKRLFLKILEFLKISIIHQKGIIRRKICI